MPVDPPLPAAFRVSDSGGTKERKKRGARRLGSPRIRADPVAFVSHPEDSNSVSWAEFRACFEELSFRGNVAGAWRPGGKRSPVFVSGKRWLQKVVVSVLVLETTWARRFMWLAHWLD